ncbi:hypothetical protein BGW39_000433, partial [Mortierella sp. 14UC]
IPFPIVCGGCPYLIPIGGIALELGGFFGGLLGGHDDDDDDDNQDTKDPGNISSLMPPRIIFTLTAFEE